MLRSSSPVSAEIVCIGPKVVDRVWPSVRAGILAAFEKVDIGRFDEIERDVLNGDALLWIVHGVKIEAVVITQIINSQKSKVCMVSALVGSGRQRWLHLESKISDYAKAEGCASMRMIGRKGWKRVLKDYAEIGVVLERQI